jgi:hypothetical protein
MLSILMKEQQMKTLALAIALACGSTLALAQAGGTDTSTAGKPAAKGAGDSYMAKEFWEKNNKGGYISREDLSRFKGADGKGVDMQKIDVDGDGKVSEREWTMYQQTAGAAGKPADTGPSPSR